MPEPQPNIIVYEPVATPIPQSDPPPTTPAQRAQAYVDALRIELANAKRSRSASDVKEVGLELKRAEGELAALTAKARPPT